jgi:hypothetical protein
MWLTWLEWCVECTGWTLVSDARDVFFQRSPFQGEYSHTLTDRTLRCCVILCEQTPDQRTAQTAPNSTVQLVTVG